MNNDLKRLELKGNQLIRSFMKIEKNIPKEFIPEDLKGFLEKQIMILDTTISVLLLLLKRINNEKP